MPFLIDGDNVLGTWPGKPRSDAGRRWLALEIGRALAGRGTIVVFDGVARDAVAWGAGVRFAGAGRTADDVMVSILAREADPRAWIVVTSDRPLGDRCRHLGARVERSDRFRARLRSRPATEKPDHVDDLDEWLAAFGEPVSEDERPSRRRRPPGSGRDDAS
jgi:hypothetical protein